MARADEAKLGRPWRDDELDAIVSDYFDMLMLDLASKPYIKAEHSRRLMAAIGRTHKAVEFKHQNISAVLDELGLPWIPGYIPKRNYQNAIFGAIERYLTRRPEILDLAPRPERPPDVSDGVFVNAPPALPDPQPEPPPGLRRLVRKFDPVERDHRNRALGQAGEEFVFHLERNRLSAQDRSDLARKVRWVAAEDGDGAGYDTLSFEPATGQERLLEVKTTNGSARTPFFLTRNEHDMSRERPEDWRIYRVHLFARDPRIFTLAPPLDAALDLIPQTWRASLR
jgi:hypothetical protein